MCRIVGIYNPSSLRLGNEIVAMRDAMQRGGPDDEGVYLDADHPLALGHRRLALIDLSPAGHQPMADLQGRLQIIFNGEIYNFHEIKSILEGFGHQFVTHSDTEVILKAYQQWGIDCFTNFNGMFALAIWDKSQQQLILARDHAGIKPLYYYLSADRLYFASEIRAFYEASIPFTENTNWRTYFLSFGNLPEPITTLQKVIPVAKGTAVVISIPSLKKKEFFFHRLDFTRVVKIEQDALHLIKTQLQAAVKRHLISDAPIGLFLSGGLDSSLLTLIAREYLGEQLHTLSIVFEEQEFSEEKYQKIIIQKTGAIHQSFQITRQDFYVSLPDIFQAMDQPTTDGINTYFISRCAHEYGLTAVLSGLGADEFFGGYPSFQHKGKYSLLSKMPVGILNLFKYTTDHRFKRIGYASMKNSIGEYLLYRGLFAPKAIAGILDCTEREVFESLSNLEAYYPATGLANGNRVSYLESNLYMQNQLLKDADFMSMWHGLEIRVPFLDRFLLNTVTQIDPVIKYKHPKYLLIKAFSDQLPEAIWKRKKQGFTFPFAQWLRSSSFIEPANSQEKGFYEAFQNDQINWSRYWSILLMNRFHSKSLSLT